MIKKVFLLIIKGYQLTTTLRPARCRFYPSCSHYSAQAIENHGLIKGLFLTIKRLIKCHPWHSGGVDLVPMRLYK